MAAQTTWPAMPAQAAVREGVADLGDTKLWFWDTGGSGDPIVLLHPGTGSGAIWGYQQPVFVRAGYRVIGYSRRGFYKSAAGIKERPGSATADLKALADFLSLDRFHILGSAAGGFIVPDFALSHPDRLHSMIIASSFVGLDDDAYRRTSARLAGRELAQMPPEFRELGPSYRAANPSGVDAWKALEAVSQVGEPVFQPMLNKITWAAMESIRTPTLILTGDADLYMPPSRTGEFARRMKDCETAAIAESGHSAYWEQPDAFNSATLDFIRRHRATSRRGHG